MNRYEKIPIIVVSLLLIFYSTLIFLNEWLLLVYMIFIVSPFLIGWLVYSTIRYEEYKGRELEKDEEWGYADKSDLHSIVKNEI